MATFHLLCVIWALFSGKLRSHKRFYKIYVCDKYHICSTWKYEQIHFMDYSMYMIFPLNPDELNFSKCGLTYEIKPANFHAISNCTPTKTCNLKTQKYILLSYWIKIKLAEDKIHLIDYSIPIVFFGNLSALRTIVSVDDVDNSNWVLASLHKNTWN